MKAGMGVAIVVGIVAVFGGVSAFLWWRRRKAYNAGHAVNFELLGTKRESDATGSDIDKKPLYKGEQIRPRHDSPQEMPAHQTGQELQGDYAGQELETPHTFHELPGHT
jgi:hypothetical protein